jgi:RNA polymerase sigma-70 factor (ECF subfamily)
VPDLGALVAENQDALFAFLLRMCGDLHQAEDLMQETFVRAIRAAAHYKPRAAVRTWLFSIAANLVRDQWRRQRVRGAVSLTEYIAMAADSPEEAVLRRLGNRRVRVAILTLPMEQRAAIVLRYFHELSYQEIAEALVCPVGTVRSRIHNGMSRLRELLRAEVDLRE